MNCPECAREIHGESCRCGWAVPTPTGPSASTPKCLTCRQHPADKGWAGKCERCGRCHGYTNGARCAFRAEAWDTGAAGFCGWHHRTVNDPQVNTLEDLAAWMARLLGARICDRWTHYTASELWDAMQGHGRAFAKWCGGGDCPHRDEPPMPGALTEPPKRPDTPTPEIRDAAWRDHVMRQAHQLRGQP